MIIQISSRAQDIEEAPARSSFRTRGRYARTPIGPHAPVMLDSWATRFGISSLESLVARYIQLCGCNPGLGACSRRLPPLPSAVISEVLEDPNPAAVEL